MNEITAQVVDCGNSAIKIGQFSKHRLVHSAYAPRLYSNALLQALQKDVPTIISNVGEPLSWLQEIKFKSSVTLQADTPLPIVLEYETPQTLGVDRIANCCAVQALFPETNCFIVDIGSCITYDFISKKGVFKGGLISPGLKFRLKAMSNFSANLPLVDINRDVQFLGQSTERALQSGGYHGMAAEIEGLIAAIKDQFTEVNIVLTGGDLIHFEKAIKSPIFALPNLTLAGLHEILLHNFR